MNVQQMSTNDLDDELMIRFATSNLTEEFYDAVVAELKARDVHPEVMATLITVGEPAWRTKHKRQRTFNAPTPKPFQLEPIFSIKDALKSALQGNTSIERAENTFFSSVLQTNTYTLEKANLRNQNFQFLN